MGMSTGGGDGGPVSDINVTPLVDVTLVLLIIFMVMTPLLQMGYETSVPPKPPPGYVPPETKTKEQVIVSVGPTGGIYINKEEVSSGEFGFRIREIVQNRKTEIVFFSCDEAVNYGEAMKLMDVIKNAGAKGKPVPIGIILEPVDIPVGTPAAPAGGAG